MYWIIWCRFDGKKNTAQSFFFFLQPWHSAQHHDVNMMSFWCWFNLSRVYVSKQHHIEIICHIMMSIWCRFDVDLILADYMCQEDMCIVIWYIMWSWTSFLYPILELSFDVIWCTMQSWISFLWPPQTPKISMISVFSFDITIWSWIPFL